MSQARILIAPNHVYPEPMTPNIARYNGITNGSARRFWDCHADSIDFNMTVCEPGWQFSRSARRFYSYGEWGVVIMCFGHWNTLGDLLVNSVAFLNNYTSRSGSLAVRFERRNAIIFFVEGF